MAPITHVLCPIDFSETSRRAVGQAVAIARWYHAHVTALHVYPVIFMPVPALPAPQDRVSESELTRVRGDAAAFLEDADTAGLNTDVVIRVGQAARQILESAAALPADLIVMGTHGAGGFERLVLGSVTEKVLRQATCPVLTVPPHAQATSRLPFARVLCAVDFSPWSDAAVALASSLAQESGAALDLVHVIEWPWSEPPAPVLAELPRHQADALGEFRRYLESGASARLESLVSGAVRDRCPVAIHVVHGKPYAQLLQVAVDIGADLIVLGVHGRNALDLTVFGSTTNHVVRQATCPVLTLRR
jgi:nucleotide-binding universal stress UspA family protein